MKPYKNFGLGALAAIGLAWILLSVLLNTSGIPGLCTNGNESVAASPNPTGELSLITTLTDCGSGNSEILIELMTNNPSPVTYILIEDGSNITADVSWISENEAEVHVGGIINFREFDGRIAKSEHVVAGNVDVYFEYQN